VADPVGQLLPGLPGLLGIQLRRLAPDHVEATLRVDAEHLVPDAEHAHAGAALTLADTACGYGCRANLPSGATGFITIELKANLLAAVRPGTWLTCVARPQHLGRRTQVWDATVTTENSTRPVALFRCTQLVL
jgi:1,4-dihydroxy-2-naphthoyl-CoA hydrolase